MARALKVALAQLSPVFGDKLKNQISCQKAAARAAKQGADVLVFAEETLTGFIPAASPMAENPSHSPTIKFFQGLAKQNRLTIIFGVALKAPGGRAANTVVVVNPGGKIILRYNKIHPFSFSGEHRQVASGQRLGIFKIKNTTAAVVICYDLRFPGLFAALARHKPEIIFVIACWPAARQEHWQTLLPARALDLQAYLTAVNITGTLDGQKYNGGSAVYSPRAEKMLDMKTRPGLRVISLPLQTVAAYRAAFSSLLDQRPALYRRWLKDSR